ncbi:MAG TPA: hypothetical protein VGF76_10990 [Polyangiaceae bacterium]
MTGNAFRFATLIAVLCTPAVVRASSFDVTVRATYIFLPNLSLQAYGQLFLSGGHSDEAERT